MILAGDIGGTKTLMGEFERDGGTLRLLRAASFPSRGHASFDEIIARFRSRGRSDVRIEAACFGVPGAVIDGRSHATNLPWQLSDAQLSTLLDDAPVRLVNDLEALAFGTLFLGTGARHALQAPATPDRTGTVAVIAAGTGLGEAMLWWDGTRHHPIASEGGHADFAPRNARQQALAEWIERRFGHASIERVLSGPGLASVYDFLGEHGSFDEPASHRTRIAQAEDRGALVGELAIAGASPRCVAALELFVDVYGQEAGNLALRCLAVGGVVLGGGIAPKILPALVEGDRFRRAFAAKGRFEPFLGQLAIDLALDPRAALLGAAHLALAGRHALAPNARHGSESK